MKMLNHTGLRTWIEIERKAIKRNFGVFRGLISKKTNLPRTKLMAVVKSNAYGHGLVAWSREMEALGADFLGVDSVTEALTLRRNGISLPILVLGYTLPEMIAEAAEAEISITVSSFETLRFLSSKSANLKKPLRIHIKVDTGMHRQGFLAHDIPHVLSLLNPKPSTLNPSVEGLYTHFASAKNPAFPKDTENQISEFQKWVAAFKKAGLKPIIHAAATAGAMIYPKSHFDMVRIGIGLYGLWPAKEVEAYLKDKVVLKPALTWKTIISEVKKIPAGSRVGYDLTEVVRENSVIAVCPIGYWHGYPRNLSSIGRVMVNGREAKLLGRVSMDMIVIDVSKIPKLKAGNEVILLGGGHPETSSENVGYLSDTSYYEIITRLNPLIKRIYV